jgi:peptidoglycan hydrolase-like protein with peptidoglycan-binding domain
MKNFTLSFSLLFMALLLVVPTALPSKARAESIANKAIVDRQLDFGARGQAVLTLQALLASDAEVYPEGMITGYFGPLTRAAVIRFQNKYGILPVGRVGPVTMGKLAKIAHDRPIIFMTIAGQWRPCAMVPPGHVIAPGYLRKVGGIVIVPECQNLPPGIADKVSTEIPPADDSKAPIISNVMASQVTDDSATITWKTHEKATSRVSYGTTTSYGSRTELDNERVTSHEVVLTNLRADTLYHYRTQSTDLSGNTGLSLDHTFVTDEEDTDTDDEDTEEPEIYDVEIAQIYNTSVVIEWKTDERATTQIDYGLTSEYGDISLNNNLVTRHERTILGLSPNTIYHYRIVARDDAGNTETTGDASFTTAGDVTAPVISAISVSDIDADSAIIHWSTNETATSKVYFSTTTPVNTSTAMTTSSSDLETSHALTLSGLQSTTTYYFKVESRDESNNTTQSSDQSFTTL